MKKLSADETRHKIIGLGESSVKKSYYPLLQEKIRDLEDKQKQLVDSVRSLEEREAELEQLLETKDALLMEVHHRVKNNLQTIVSLLSLGSANTSAPLEFSLFEKTRKRIETISLIYQEFLFSENYLEATLCALLRAIAGEIRSETEKTEIQLIFDFPVNEIIVGIDAAVSLALIAHEVISNSFSYAFEGGSGRLRITFNHEDENDQNESDGAFRLVISDTGPGFSLDSLESRKESFGMTLIVALVSQIGGEYFYEKTKEGLSFILNFRL